MKSAKELNCITATKPKGKYLNMNDTKFYIQLLSIQNLQVKTDLKYFYLMLGVF